MPKVHVQSAQSTTAVPVVDGTPAARRSSMLQGGLTACHAAMLLTVSRDAC